MLVVDNCDDTETLFTAPLTEVVATDGSVIEQFLEQLRNCAFGSILFTTRSENVAAEMVDGKHVIGVEPMSNMQAVALLRRKMGSKSKDEGVLIDLASALDRIPLALAQAAAYIAKHKSCSVMQYLSLLRNDSSAVGPLELNTKHHDFRRDRDACNAILPTWSLSFDHIEKVRPTAADLLSLMSFFDRQAIPIFAIRPPAQVSSSEGCPATMQKNEEDAIAFNFAEDISTLQSYMFISSTTDEGQTYEMHRLVQLATTRWLSMRKTNDHWRRLFVERLDFVFPPEGTYEHQLRCETLYPHVKKYVKPIHELLQEDKETSLRLASVMYRASQYALQKGSAGEGKDMGTISQHLRDRHLGNAHSLTMRSTAMIVRSL